MLTDEQLEEVKQEYCNLLRSLERDGSDIDGLISYLEGTDFFDAPASTKYHCSFPGGLCLHSLNVYSALRSLVERFASDYTYSDDTIKIVALCHDFGKINFYEPYIKNEKVYSKQGKNFDAMGNFDWVPSRGYKVKEPEDRAIVGSKSFRAYMIANNFIPLTQGELVTLVNQYSASDGQQLPDLSNILAKYNLAVYLHCADIIATYCIEK